jgi:hypothetical protein
LPTRVETYSFEVVSIASAVRILASLQKVIAGAIPYRVTGRIDGEVDLASAAGGAGFGDRRTF